MNLDDNLPDVTAAAWFLILVGGLVGVATLFVIRVPITGSVGAETVIRSVVQPLAYAIGAVIVIVSYVASIELFGKTQTNGAISRIVELIEDAGAANELREMNYRNDDDDDNDNE